jgi:hypothetical protein
LGTIYSSTLWPWRRRQHVSVKHWYPFMVSYSEGHDQNITLKLCKHILHWLAVLVTPLLLDRLWWNLLLSEVTNI